jgi:hypothetical protein
MTLAPSDDTYAAFKSQKGRFFFGGCTALTVGPRGASDSKDTEIISIVYIALSLVGVGGERERGTS